MKKLIAIAIAASMMLVGTSAFAQVSIGAGYVSSALHEGQGDPIMANGFNVGGEYLISEGTGFGISVGAYFSYLTSSAQYLKVVSTKTEQMYLDAPVRLNLSADLGTALRGFIFAGPVFSYGLKYEGSGSVAGISGGTDMYQQGIYNRFDILVGGGVGVDYNNKLRLKVGYDFGMLNRLNSENVTANRNVLQAGVAFLF